MKEIIRINDKFYREIKLEDLSKEELLKIVKEEAEDYLDDEDDDEPTPEEIKIMSGVDLKEFLKDLIN